MGENLCITVCTELDRQATSFGTELGESRNDGISMKALEPKHPNVARRPVNKEKGIPISKPTKTIAKNNINMHLSKCLGGAW
jgi:hypothetical protein